MAYELIVLDLDGTLTNSKKEITPATRQALIDIQKAGKKVVLASGRPEKGVIKVAKELEMDKYGSYILSFNGARIRQTDNHEIVYSQLVPREYWREAYEMVLEAPGVDIIAYDDNNSYSGIVVNEYTILADKINDVPIIEVENFPEAIDFPVNCFHVAGDPELLGPLTDRMSERFEGRLSCFRSDPYYLNIMPLGIDKATSLLALLDHLGLTRENMIACGDGYNDISMIEVAGLGVAMANAMDVVKEAADYITLSNDEDGVLHVINQFMRD